MNFPSKRHQEWEKGALNELRMGYKGQFDGRVSIAYMFYQKDNRARDLDNQIASCNDVLVKAGILKDDSWQNLAIASADAEIDKESPRAVLYVYDD